MSVEREQGSARVDQQLRVNFVRTNTNFAQHVARGNVRQGSGSGFESTLRFRDELESELGLEQHLIRRTVDVQRRQGQPRGCGSGDDGTVRERRGGGGRGRGMSARTEHVVGVVAVVIVAAMMVFVATRIVRPVIVVHPMAF